MGVVSQNDKAKKDEMGRAYSTHERVVHATFGGKNGTKETIRKT
jgi:hypothetical protein